MKAIRTRIGTDGDLTMNLNFTVLASGSAGNCSVVETGDGGVLLDIGLGPRNLTARLSTVGSSIARVRAVLLTHTHSDHWNENALATLARRRIPLFCHRAHFDQFENYSQAFADLRSAGLIREYEPSREFAPIPSLRCIPLLLRHDSGATFGFRIHGPRDLFGDGSSLGYAADLGSWDDALPPALAQVDLLALEFNHDVQMQYTSGRHPQLIARVLGDHGHLSNEQAAALLRLILHHSDPGKLKYLVQLHLSRQCNHPGLARQSAKQVLAEVSPSTTLHTAEQDTAGPTIRLGDANQRTPRRNAGVASRSRSRRGNHSHPNLPGME